MYGRTVGTLRVQIQSIEGLTDIWEKHGNKGPEWKKASLEVDLKAGEMVWISLCTNEYLCDFQVAVM